MLKRIASMLVVLMVVAAVFAGCGGNTADTPNPASQDNAAGEESGSPEGEEVKKDIRIAYISKSLDQVWFQNVSAALKETAEKLGVKEVILVDAQMNPDTYMTALDNVIAQKVDGIIVCIPDQKLSRVTVDKCNAAGIPVLADADALIENDKKLAPSFELDAYLVGKQMGEWLVEYVKSNNLIKDSAATGYMVLAMPTVNSCVPRSEGARDAWDAGIDVLPKGNVVQGDYKGASEEAFNVMAAAINAHPGIKTWFVTAPNDEGAQGATRALEQAGLDKDAVVVGIGGYLAKDEFKKPFSCFIASAYIDPKEDGETVATAMYEKIVNDKEIFAEYKKEGDEFGMYPLGAKMVTKENYKEIMGNEAE